MEMVPLCICMKVTLLVKQVENAAYACNWVVTAVTQQNVL